MKRALQIWVFWVVLLAAGFLAAEARETVLIEINGPVQWGGSPDPQTMHAMNTSTPLFLDTMDRQMYLKYGSYWYSAREIEGTWLVNYGVPMYVQGAVPQLPAGKDQPVNIVVSMKLEPLAQPVPNEASISGPRPLYNSQPHSNSQSFCPPGYCAPAYPPHVFINPQINFGVGFNPWSHHWNYLGPSVGIGFGIGGIGLGLGW